MTQIKVKNMHCDACKTLVKMELEENNLDNLITDFSIDTEENIGTLELVNPTKEEIMKIKTVVNSMEGYTTM